MEPLIDIASYNGSGTGGTLTGGRWNVLLLNFLPRLQPESIASMQKHTDTDECFILLQGRGMLFVADGEAGPECLQHYPMEAGKIYLVPKGIWHAPAMTPDAKILLVENSDMAPDGSPRCALNEAQIQQIRHWGKNL